MNRFLNSIGKKIAFLKNSSRSKKAFEDKEKSLQGTIEIWKNP
jgi:hypothetical protein